MVTLVSYFFKLPFFSDVKFQVRQVGNIQLYTVQCVLVINLFNEKIFVLLWFWYMILAVFTIASFFYWLILLSIPCFSRWFVSQNLELSELKFDPDTRSKEVQRFISGYLHLDGIFVLRMVTLHAGVIFGTDLTLALWNSFYGIEEKLSEGRTSIEDRKDNMNNYLRQRKKSKKKSLDADPDSVTAFFPLTPESREEESSSDESRQDMPAPTMV
ncbi:hypothetical protein AB6A40_003021 [Gnathostoma spinigerum]|uniref:Innexin n=1 Tax=Gnathostoma spinigerum TaxID=75299 RepID=A0ABD6EIB3_9BILA